MQNHLKETLLACLAEHQNIRLALLFGSLARDGSTRESDLDIAVDAGRRLSPDEKQSLIAELAVKTGRPIDLVDLQVAGEPLLGQILQYGQRITGSDEAYAGLLRRHLFDQSDFLPYRDRILAERRREWIGRS